MYFFNQNLIYLREKKGFTQQQMAAKLCTPQKEFSIKTYQSYEEARAWPKPQTLVRICDVLQFTDIYSLLTRKIEKDGKR